MIERGVLLADDGEPIGVSHLFTADQGVVSAARSASTPAVSSPARATTGAGSGRRRSCASAWHRCSTPNSARSTPPNRR